MKNLILILIAVMSVSSFAGVKIGVINMQKVLGTIKAGKAVKATLDKSVKAKQKQLKKEEGELKKLQSSIQKQSSLLSKKALAKKENELRTRYIALQKKSVDFEKQIRKQEAELKKPIIKNLNPIIDSVSKSKNVDITFDLLSAPIFYAKEKINITKDVIKAYDKKHK